MHLFLQLENIGNFVRAIVEYGLKPHDIFEANDLFENVNHTQVQSTLIALAGMVRTIFIDTPTHSPPQKLGYFASVDISGVCTLLE